jgi:hypothetical protein
MRIEKLIYLHALLSEAKELLVKASTLTPKGQRNVRRQDRERRAPAIERRQLRECVGSALSKISYAMTRIGEITTQEEV